MPDIRTFYPSFADNDRPRGDRFLGACLVDVTEDDARAARTMIALKFPNAREGAEWIGAASTVAHRHGCNPGGEMLSVDVTDQPEAARYPHNKLLSRADLEQLGPVRQIGEDQTS
jgi:hypothetical protein